MTTPPIPAALTLSGLAVAGGGWLDGPAEIAVGAVLFLVGVFLWHRARHERAERVRHGRRAEAAEARERDLREMLFSPRTRGDFLDVDLATGVVHHITPTAAALFGGTPGDFEGRPYIENVHPDDRERTLVAVAAIEPGGFLPDFENRWSHMETGGWVPVLWRQFTADGRIWKPIDRSALEAERERADDAEADLAAVRGPIMNRLRDG